MSNTHKHTHLQLFMLRHRGVIQAVTLGIALNLTLPLQTASVQQAHFLQRPIVSAVSSASSRISAPALQRRSHKSSARATIIRRTTTVAQHEQHIPAKEMLRPAAASSRATTAAIRGTAARAPTIVPVSSHSSNSSISSISSASSTLSSFPAFGHALHPVSRIPDWGDMRTPAEWNRTYGQLTEEDFVPVPAYDMTVLTVPMETLLADRNNPETIRILTAKLYYSTRHFSAYDVDSGEFSSDHPGIDLKLAEGTPVGAVAGGRIHDVRRDNDGLGLHVLIEHRAPDGQTYYSVYGHLATTNVSTGDTVTAGQMIGTVGTTGFTTGPHIHLQIDLGEADEQSHTVYMPAHTPTRAEAARNTINPIEFISRY